MALIEHILSEGTQRLVIPGYIGVAKDRIVVKDEDSIPKVKKFIEGGGEFTFRLTFRPWGFAYQEHEVLGRFDFWPSFQAEVKKGIPILTLQEGFEYIAKLKNE